MPQPTTPVWFITGCSSGFGHELAKYVLERGYHTVVTAPDKNKIKHLIIGKEDRALALKLDVTKQDEVEAAIRQTEATFGRIDVLVNNAGYGYLGAMEESEEDEVRAMFETNFFGAARLIHLALPGMRQRRSGTIVNFSSASGLSAIPSLSYYSATKFAIEGLSDGLAKEVGPLGIKVVVVEPSAFRTRWLSAAHESPHEIRDYAITSAGATRRELKASQGNEPGDPTRAAAAIVEAVESPNPPLHLLLGHRALEIAEARIETLQKDIETWKETTLKVDFPEEEQ